MLAALLTVAAWMVGIAVALLPFALAIEWLSGTSRPITMRRKTGAKRS
ncbi:hypothetical protein [Vineibacter terrae]|nr:hypothetical protein [Vineibacter terrae]HEX2885710.1 hypothetical protein [Vineibacter terrae]